MSDGDQINLRDFIERIIQERDRLYDSRLKSLETYFAAALAAMERATTSAFAAAEKAIEKAEKAQSEYNIRSNEFRGQLDDQNKVMSTTMMPRTESLAVLKGVDEKISSMSLGLDSRISLLRIDMDKAIESLKQDIVSLREYRSHHGGHDEAQREDRSQSNWGVGTVIAIVTALFSLMMGLAAILIKGKMS